MKKLLFIFFAIFSLSFVLEQKESAMIYVITTSNELGKMKITNDVSNQMFVVPKSLEIDRRKYLIDKLTKLWSTHSDIKFRDRSFHLNAGDYFCIATAHLVHTSSDVGRYQRFYFVKSSNKEDIQSIAEKEVNLFVNKAHLDHITYDISRPFLPQEKDYWTKWSNGLKDWFFEIASEEDKTKVEKFKKNKEIITGVRG